MSDGKFNILWICTDQQRFDTLGCYGNRFVDTPNLDKLAQEGVLFEYAFTQSPVCTPSRACFLTGRYPRTTRTRQNGQCIPEDETLVTKFLHDQGYICGLSGKLHISACEPSFCKGTERRIDDGYDEFHWSHHPNPDWPTNEYIHWLRQKGVEYKFSEHPKSKNFVRIGMPEEYHQTTWCVEKAIDFIHAHANKKFHNPWLFSINPFDPHDAYDPPEDLLKKYYDILDQIPLPDYQEGELKAKSIFQQLDHQNAYNTPNLFPFPKMTQTDHKLIKAAYWAMCELIDRQIGKLIDTLKETNQYENTIIIFHSDHGEMLGDHGIYLKGPHFYEPAVHIPLIIAGPTIKKGIRSKALIELVDLAPTILELIGFDKLPSMQGKSFASILTGKSDPHYHRENIYCEYYNALTSHRNPLSYATMIRNKQFKLIVYHTIDFGELYDLENDPKEFNNLWNNADYLDIKIKLLKKLTDRMAFTVDPLPLRVGSW